MTDVELCACGTFWKSVGDAMGISYADLHSSAEGWDHGLQWLEELKIWSVAYEEAHMVPTASNRKLAERFFALLLINIPARYLPPCKTALSVLFGERLRRAMM